MSLFKEIRSYILEDEFQLNVYPNKVDIINYETIGQIDTNKVTIHYHGGSVVIKGQNLVVSRLLNDEVLVIGIIQNIELR